MTLRRYLHNNFKTILWIFGLVWLGVFIYLSADNGLSLFEVTFFSGLFGLISAVICTTHFVLFFFIFPEIGTSDPSYWDPKFILSSLFNIITISLANYAFVIYLNGSEFSFSQYLTMLGLTIAIGILVNIVVYFYESNKKLKHSLDKARPIHDHLGNTNPNSKAIDWTIQVNGETKSINIESLLFIESNRNYVKLHFSGAFSTELRITLKEIEHKLSDFDFLKRCHRSFIVNLNKVGKVTGNSTGYVLQIDSPNAVSVQVSRSHVESIKAWLEGNRKSVLIPS